MMTQLLDSEATKARRKGRPRLEEAADIDQAIRKAAIDVVLQHGEAATLNAVAQEAGISRKSLYARYPSRSELFIEVIRDVMNEPESASFDITGPVEAALFAYVYRMLEIVSSPRSITIQRLLTVDPAYIGALKSEMRASSDRHFYQPLLALLRQAAASGEIVTIDHEATARSIIHLIFAASHSFDPERVAARGDNWQESFARFLTDFVCKGLLPRTAG